MVIAMGGCAVRPLLRTQAGEISQPPASVAVAVAVVDRPRQEASHQAEEVAEAEVVRPAGVWVCLHDRIADPALQAALVLRRAPRFRALPPTSEEGKALTMRRGEYDFVRAADLPPEKWTGRGA